MILVTGDVVLDHNVYAGLRMQPVSESTPGTLFDKQPGGARLAFGLLEQLLPGRVEFGLANVSSPGDFDNWPVSLQVGALWKPVDGMWQLSENLGYGPSPAEE